MDFLDVGAPPVAGLASLDSSAGSLFASFGGVLFCYAVAALLVGVGILAAWVWRAPGERGAVSVAQGAAQPAAGAVAAPVIGKVTGMVNCRWAMPTTATTLGADVIRWRVFALESGMLEITYSGGPKVVIEGPALFSADFRNSGYLHYGKLTVSTPVATVRPLFCIHTPTAVVTERGNCVFGVDVGKAPAATDSGLRDATVKKPTLGSTFGNSTATSSVSSTVYVFRGRVEFQVPEYWARNGVLVLEERDWLVSGLVNGTYKIESVKAMSTRLTQEFVAKWLDRLPDGFVVTKGEKTRRKGSPNS